MTWRNGGISKRGRQDGRDSARACYQRRGGGVGEGWSRARGCERSRRERRGGKGLGLILLGGVLVDLSVVLATGSFREFGGSDRSLED